MAVGCPLLVEVRVYRTGPRGHKGTRPARLTTDLQHPVRSPARSTLRRTPYSAFIIFYRQTAFIRGEGLPEATFSSANQSSLLLATCNAG
jgi:hypothetical protein